MRPLVTVLVDTYNHERYIEQALVSVLEQDFPAGDLEILVVDDGSTDRTPDTVRKFEPRVKLLRKTNGGQASAFNAGLAGARGEVIAFLDGDDWFAPGKLTAVMATLEQHPEAAAVGHGHYQFNEETKDVRVFAPPVRNFLQPTTPAAALEAARAASYLAPGSLTARKRILERAMPIPEALIFCADTPIIMASIAAGVFMLGEPLYYYRLHQNNLFSVGPENRKRALRSRHIHELALKHSRDLLLKLGVNSESVRALVRPGWTTDRRWILSLLRGNRLKTFRSEMRYFDADFPKARTGQRILQYLLVAAATLLLPPYQFYRLRERLFPAGPHVSGGGDRA